MAEQPVNFDQGLELSLLHAEGVDSTPSFELPGGEAPTEPGLSEPSLSEAGGYGTPPEFGAGDYGAPADYGTSADYASGADYAAGDGGGGGGDG